MEKIRSFIIAGTPGAGKSTLLSKVKLKNAKLVNMGSEILKYAKSSDRDKLRYLSFEEQKELRARAIRGLIRKGGNVIIDTHLTVEQNGRFLPGFSISELKKLNTKALIYIDASAKEIIARREKDKSRKRENESEEEINTQRSLNIAFMASAASELNIPILIFRNSEGMADEVAGELEKALNELIR
ncbi:MAG: AAA family ATPase [Candidatus Micrarchaeota archaeon]